MSRRGFLGGLAAALGGGALGQGRAPDSDGYVVRVANPRPFGIGMGSVAGCAETSLQESPQVLAFRKAIGRAYDQRRRLEQRLSLTGGVPPGILACKSWRPWFAAAAVERWRDEHMPDMSLVERAIRISVGWGDDE